MFEAHNIKKFAYDTLWILDVCACVYALFGHSSAYDKDDDNDVTNLQALKHQVNRWLAAEGSICLLAMCFVHYILYIVYDAGRSGDKSNKKQPQSN